MTLRIRVRVLLPRPSEVGSFGISLLGHLAILTAILVVGSRRGISNAPLPAMTVRLAAPAAAPLKPRASASKPRKPAVQTPAKTSPSPKPKKKASNRIQARTPKTVVDRPKGATAQPERLPEAEPRPSPEPTPPQPAATGTGKEESVLPEGPIPGGIAGLETDEPFTADWYVGLVVARLSEAWRDRPVLPYGAPPQRVVVAFTILADGRVTQARVLVPSEYAPLNYSALRAVQSIRRFPSLPRSYERESLSARFVFELVPPSSP